MFDVGVIMAELSIVQGYLRLAGDESFAIYQQAIEALERDDTAEYERLKRVSEIRMHNAFAFVERLKDDGPSAQMLRRAKRILAQPDPAPWWRFWR